MLEIDEEKRIDWKKLFRFMIAYKEVSEEDPEDVPKKVRSKSNSRPVSNVSIQPRKEILVYPKHYLMEILYLDLQGYFEQSTIGKIFSNIQYLPAN